MLSPSLRVGRMIEKEFPEAHLESISKDENFLEYI
jgi:hypothetical protein